MNDLTIYDTFAESWWQAGSPLHLLARMNPARFAYFDPLVRHWAGLRVLDVGCGGGLAAACLVQRGARVVGLDLSQASLRVAARQTRRPGCPEAVFTCGRAEALPFADASFEVVWCTDVLEHLADLLGGDRADRPGAETRRALRVRYDQSLLALPAAGDRVLGIPRPCGATGHPRLAVISDARRTPPAPDPPRPPAGRDPGHAAGLVVALARLAVPPDTVHRYSLPGICCEACGAAAGWGRRAQASGHGAQATRAQHEPRGHGIVLRACSTGFSRSKTVRSDRHDRHSWRAARRDRVPRGGRRPARACLVGLTHAFPHHRRCAAHWRGSRSNRSLWG